VAMVPVKGATFAQALDQICAVRGLSVALDGSGAKAVSRQRSGAEVGSALLRLRGRSNGYSISWANSCFEIIVVHSVRCRAKWQNRTQLDRKSGKYGIGLSFLG